MLEEGQLIDNYKLIKPLAQGAFAFLWLAERQTFLNAQFVLRISPKDLVDIKIFQKEIDVWKRVSGHPNILPIIDAGVYQEFTYTVSEFSGEGTLRDLLRYSNGSLDIKRLTTLLQDILDGLEFLHLKGIVHRDLKPENIFIQGGKPRIGDFGISEELGETKLTEIAGTPIYMSPEAFDGGISYQHDIWSLGIILYEMLTGEVPFKATSIVNLISIIREPVVLPNSTPDFLKNIVNKCLEVNLAKRFKSVSEIQDVLDGWIWAERSIINSKETLNAYFGFPDELKSSCEQYLLYFARFLQDLGINATSNLTEEAGKVLFSVTPTDDIEALDKIREALAVYLHLPESPIVYNESFAAMRLKKEIDSLHYAQSMMENELRSAQYTLRLAQQTVESQDKIIQQKDSIIEQQNRVIEKVTSKSIMMDSVEKKEEFEKIFDGLEVGESKELKEKLGIKFNPATSLKTIGKKIIGRDDDIISLDLNKEE